MLEWMPPGSALPTTMIQPYANDLYNTWLKLQDYLAPGTIQDGFYTANSTVGDIEYVCSRVMANGRYTLRMVVRNDPVDFNGYQMQYRPDGRGYPDIFHYNSWNFIHVIPDTRKVMKAYEQ